MTEVLPSTTAGEVVELSFLATGAQVADLEAIAFQRGMTVAEMVRRVLRDFIRSQAIAESETSPLRKVSGL